jgi:hypothetical protein
VAAAAGALLACALGSGCGAVLGLDDLRYTADGAAGGGEGGTLVDGGGLGPPDAPQSGDVDARASFTIATGQNQPKAIAVDGTLVYWVNAGGGGTVQRALKDGGGPVEVIATAQPTPLDVAVDAQNVYWSVTQPVGSAGTSFACNAMFIAKDSDASTPTCATQTQYATLRMTLNDDDVVLLTQGASANAQYLGFATKSVSLTPYVNRATQGTATVIAASDSSIWVSNGSGNHIDEFPIMANSVGAAGPNLCVDDCGDKTIEDFVLDVNHLDGLWVTADGFLFTAVLANTNPTGTQLANLGSAPQRMTSDAYYVYVTVVAQGGSVIAVPIAGADGGANAITLASGQEGAFGIATDGAFVYWTTTQSGLIRAVPVPPPP